ncbi:WG repeat-containing protein [Pedobacter nototheniae]|uniref:WG repeat-containing protein n=1 Tax=Pedobacter nototheniae TaxID=2488994 RepID=UPI00292D98BE|nr:WG repeat-containing protein [Pedobacter nototheniae]
MDYLLSYLDTTSGKKLVGFKSVTGKIIIKAKYLSVGYESDTPEKMYKVALVYDDSGWVYINRQDSIILRPFIYDSGPDYLEEGLFRFVENGKMGFANKNYEKIIPAMFDFVTFFENGIAEYTLGGSKSMHVVHWSWGGGYDGGYINKAGQLFSRVTDFKNNQRQAWTLDKKHVLLNKQGQVIKTFSK